MEAGVQQSGDHDLQGRHGLGAVTAAVVLQDDGAGPGMAEDVADDLADAGPGPVARVYRPVDRIMPVFAQCWKTRGDQAP
jgi:hypothetical protein